MSELVVDPAGTPTAGATAFVKTADGYNFLVKVPGESFYNLDVPPVGFEVVSIENGTVTAKSDILLEDAVFGSPLTEAEFTASFAGEDIPGDIQPPVDVIGSEGVEQTPSVGNGSRGRNGALFVPPRRGGDGDPGPTLTRTLNIDVNASANDGWKIGSVGGNGGRGGNSYLSFHSGRQGGDGGRGGNVTATQGASSTILTSGVDNRGIFAFSRSGRAGAGGSGWAAPGGGSGGSSTNGGTVIVNQQGAIFTSGTSADGVYALSVSNTGGSGGDQWGIVGRSGGGGTAGGGGAVTVNASGTIVTGGAFANGILAQSMGGTGGAAGSGGNLLVNLIGSGDNGGNGSTVTVTNSGVIQTGGAFARGIMAQSIGGGGGSGGAGGGLVSLALGGVGSDGGDGGAVTVTNAAGGEIRTSGTGADGILAQSIGGSGGEGANSAGLVSVGGAGSGGGSGAAVSVSNFGVIATGGARARGIVAQSIGGGGGDGGSSSGMVSVGGRGATGSNAATVNVWNDGVITTEGDDATGIMAQSIGGGGGNGGSSGSIGDFASVTIGGDGGGSGDGGDATVTLSDTEPSEVSLVRTRGARATGVFVQSVGGGGGNGGGAVSVSAGALGAASVAVGGSARSGGDGGMVRLSGTGSASVQTFGEDAPGIFLQSVGGGGGNGGFAVSVAASAGPISGSFSVGIGGSGGDGGDGGEVRVGAVDASGDLIASGLGGSVVTGGARAPGLMFQSVGGGGGNGGLAIAVAGSGSLFFSGNLSIGVGGSGGTAGLGDRVRVFTDASVATLGDYSTGLLVQSVGGGGGNGGGALAAGVSGSGGVATGINLGVGGSGGAGSHGGRVDLIAGGASVQTSGDFSPGVLAQSVGGGGGNGGYSVAAGLSVGGGGAGALQVGLGGSGSSGGAGGEVTARVDAAVRTRGADAPGVLVQSVGGGGGNGGFNVSGTATGSGAGSGAVTVGLGGGGGAGSGGGTVLLAVENSVTTAGDRSAGVIAQSVGGGGGNGGFNVSGAVSGAGTGSGSVGIGLGGTAGAGNHGARTEATVNGEVRTAGHDSAGIVVQSVGGGGGNGGFNVSAAVSVAGAGSGALAVGLGGRGAAGGDGGDVVAATTNRVTTVGRTSAGILAQSVGGGGGNGGFNVAPSLSIAGTGSGAVSAGFGGSGDGGGDGGAVTLTVQDLRPAPAIAADPVTVLTLGEDSAAVIAQSVGGGGGNGGINVSPTGSGAGTGSGALAVGLGGRGEAGGTGGAVSSTVTADLETRGEGSTGLLVQSVGGGGGNGGINVSVAVSAAGAGTVGAAVGLGGTGGTGSDGGEVISTFTGDVTTGADTSPGVVVQSLGGGGGNGGINLSLGASLSKSGSAGIGVGIGGAGGSGANGQVATGTVTGDVRTLGERSPGVVVQSVGGGGGNGGLNIAGAISLSGSGSGTAAIGVGGLGSDGGQSGDVTGAFTGTAATEGARSPGIVAQSLAGGGGNGGLNISGAISAAPGFAGAIGIGVGGFGFGGGEAGSVDHVVAGRVDTWGEDSIGIVTQSLGGGGGNGGTNISVGLSLSKSTSAAIGIGVGGFGDAAGNAGETTSSTVTGGVVTRGARSSAIVTQSLGGGGGTGGTNITGAVSLTKGAGGALGLGLGGFGGGGGDGQVVTSTVRTTAADDVIRTEGTESIGVLAQSVGGGGGAGGLNVSGGVSLTGQSGAAIGMGVGGFGGVAGNAGTVTLDMIGDVDTHGDRAHGIVAMSQGGGGGVGGTNVSGALSVTKPSGTGTILSAAMGVGGFGGGAGDASDVEVLYTGSLVAVPRTRRADGSLAVDLKSGANGIVASSIGGGGGVGGVNVSAGLSIGSRPGAGQSDPSSSYGLLVGVGGFGGGAGNAGGVTVGLGAGSSVMAHGSGRSGVLATSIGGGGGAGGLNVSGGIVSDTSLIVGVGGLGGNAGSGADVTVRGQADIFVTTDPDDLLDPDDATFETRVREVLGDVVDVTIEVLGSSELKQLVKDLGLFDAEADEGDSSAGILAQSIGGGGGAGGLNVSGGMALSKDGRIPSITFGIGGFGGDANTSGEVLVDHGGVIGVEGNWKHGIFAQSVAGGGGAGGLNVAGQLNWNGSQASDGATDLSIVAGLGGHGGDGADAGGARVLSDGDISARGAQARGILAQSVGGGGGTGGINVSAVATRNSSPVGIGVGGFGAGGGDAGAVTVIRGAESLSAGLIATDGRGGHGIEASSIGGGGGSAGLNALLGFTSTPGSQSDGGSAEGRKVPVHAGVDASVIPNFNAVLDELEGNTRQTSSSGEKTSVAALIAIGGSAGNAGDGGTVEVIHFGDVVTRAGASHGAFAQSIGGGGGNAALNFGLIKQSGSADRTKGIGVSIGGGTGNGGTGGTVALANTGDVRTMGGGSHGLFAQSVGGGGGNVGYDQVKTGAEAGEIEVSIGRRGGTGGSAGAVTAGSAGTVQTDGDRAHGIFAQSVGNGGGTSSTTSLTLGTPPRSDEEGSSYSLNVGLEGGEGGSAGTVDVTASGAIRTAGTGSHAIFAQSVGGGGGEGGGAGSTPGAGTSISMNIGGTGGSGGTGGAVIVASAADILTEADRAYGILAQSVGGAGGTGGYAKSAAAELNAPGVIGAVEGSDVGTTMAISIGGSGGVGMAADLVDVLNDGRIVTGGANAHGVFAQSVGGGGGQGGAVEHNIVNLRGTVGSQATVLVGGDGGSGAVSGTVTVRNLGQIGTAGAVSAGVFAQSVGGGGGDAQTVSNVVLSANSDHASTGALLLGGSGGSGGAAGTVSVLNGAAALITTEGRESHGILAQSVGGGGGTGGTVVTVGGTGAGLQSRSLRVALGGSGGDGGTGALVEVTNGGTIVTRGEGAHGILAQSVGGGGGSGGASIVGTVDIAAGTSFDPSLGFSIGGAGGAGHAGGSVTVENSGDIAVFGARAYGIKAQSVGGGGGSGGMAIALSTGDLAAPMNGPTWTDLSIGGAGGDGADGGEVTVTHSGSIAADGEAAYGIFAQSIGGGGGAAGLTMAAPGVMLADYLFSTTLGSRGGSDGMAGAVMVTSTGDIEMTGPRSQAIFRQSVNGGGGSFATELDFAAPAGTTAPDSPPLVEGSVTLGAEDADGTAGAAILAQHAGDTVTRGRASAASLTQSIGGGGGQGSAAFVLDAGSEVDLTLRLGGTSTDNAPGGAIAITRTGDVGTTGAGSQAVSVQSVAGGGGRLVTDLEVEAEGQARARAAAVLTLGAGPGAGNHGGTLDLAFSGNTITMGDTAPALVLQSIGAGGGQSFLTGLTTARAAMGATGGSTGDGGDIRASNRGAVVTGGVRSDGIVVQSIGGGGGYVRTDLAAAALEIAANGDNAGDGGGIDFAQSGGVYATGDGAVGILLQSLGGGGGVVDGAFRRSAGGAGRGGPVVFAGVGNVIADGAGGIAVFAQSSGRDGAEAITLGLDGVIKGGAGGSAAAIRIDGGAGNLLALGAESLVFALEDLAIAATDGDDAVISQGQIVGNIDLGGGANALTNSSGGVVVTRDRVVLGSGGIFTNAGVLQPGGEILNPELRFGARRADMVMGPAVAQTTDLVGSLLMTPTSLFLVDASFRTDGAAGEGSDLIRVTGDVTVNGRIEPALLSFERAGALTIVTSGGASIDAGATVRDTAVINFSIETGSIVLRAVADFTLPGMTRNQSALGGHINAILNGDGSASLGPLFAYIGNMQDAADVVDTLDRLTTEGYAVNRFDTWRAGLRFADAFDTCEARSADAVRLPSGECWWVSTGGSRTYQDAARGFGAMSSESAGLFVGFERKLDAIWSFGVAAGFERSSGAAGARFTSEADRGHFGMSLERRDGPLSFGGSVTTSLASVQSTRPVGISDVLPDGTPIVLDAGTSRQSINLTNLRLAAAYHAPTRDGRFYVEPSIDLDLGYLRSGRTRESGLGDYGMALGRTGQWMLSASPSLEVGGTLVTGKGTLFAPYLKGGVTIFGSDEMRIDSRFAGAPASAVGFGNYFGFDQVVGRISTGVVIEGHDDHLSLELGYDGMFGNNSSSHMAHASVRMRF